MQWAYIRIRKNYNKNIALYIMTLPGLITLVMFHYIPIYGVLMAFQKYSPSKGIWGSNWVGMHHFVKFFESPYFERILGNTLILGIFTVAFSFPAPILLALLLNEIKHEKFKRAVQTISYMPYFISVVIVVGLIKDLTSYNEGVINDMILLLGGEKINFFSNAAWFRPIYIISDIWSGIGYSSIIYLAAISGINPELYESAVLDGASRAKQAIHITLPCIIPTITVLLIFAVGGILGNNFQKILLMQSPLTYSTSDVISTYMYREGLLGGSFSYSTAIGLFTSLVSLFFLLITNYAVKKVGENSLL